jgi:subtilase family serine protease
VTTHSSLDVEQIRGRQLAQTELPDLVPVDKASPGAGAFCVLRNTTGWRLIVTIKNQGGPAGPSATEVDFLRGGASVAKSSRPTKALLPGEETEVEFMLPQGWITGEGTFPFKITADISMAIAETDEANNIANGACKIIG